MPETGTRRHEPGSATRPFFGAVSEIVDAEGKVIDGPGTGKIMFRILRKIAEDDHRALGDTSTLADPTVVDDLVDNRRSPNIFDAVRLKQLAVD